MGVRRVVWMLGLVCWSVVVLEADDGHERTDKLIERIDETVKEMSEGRKRLEKTLAAYKDMLSREEKGRRSAYKELVNGLEKQEERARELRKCFEDLEKEAEKYFKEWNKSLKDIEAEELRERSSARLTATRERFQVLIRTGHEARAGFGAVVAGLQDQVVYVGHDLNQASVASLEQDRTKIGELAQRLLVRIDGYAAAAKAYVASLNP